jgi:hypothetical protein
MMNHGRRARPYATTLLKEQTIRLPLFFGVSSVGLYKSADALARSPEIRSSEATFINGLGWAAIGRNPFLKATGSQMYTTNATSRNGNRNAGAVRHAAFTIASTHRRSHMLANKNIRGLGSKLVRAPQDNCHFNYTKDESCFVVGIGFLPLPT